MCFELLNEQIIQRDMKSDLTGTAGTQIGKGQQGHRYDKDRGCFLCKQNDYNTFFTFYERLLEIQLKWFVLNHTLHK